MQEGSRFRLPSIGAWRMARPETPMIWVNTERSSRGPCERSANQNPSATSVLRPGTFFICAELARISVIWDRGWGSPGGMVDAADLKSAAHWRAGSGPAAASWMWCQPSSLTPIKERNLAPRTMPFLAVVAGCCRRNGLKPTRAEIAVRFEIGALRPLVPRIDEDRSLRA